MSWEKGADLKQIYSDVLIIGGGAAGPYAALHLANAGLDVVLATKGLIGKSGCATKVVYYMHPGEFVSPDSEETAERGWIDSFSCYLGDQELMKRTTELNREIVPELEKLGLVWRRNLQGDLVRAATGYAKKDGTFRLRNLLASKYGETGKAIAEVLRNHLLLTNVKLLEETTVASLLVSSGRVYGAVLLDYVRSSLFVVFAKAVVIAAGTGGGYIWTYSTSPRENTGDGLMLAYRAGAELSGLEFQLWHATETANPSPWNRSLYVYPFAVPPKMEVPHILDSNGNRVMPDLEDSAMWKQCNSLYERLFKRGLATKDGGYFADLRHIDQSFLREYNTQEKFFRKIGLDTTKDPIEVHMSVHTMLGGIRINSKTETNIRGLYAIGGAAATFLPMLHVALATARIAAAEIPHYIKQVTEMDFPQKDVLKQEIDKILNLRRNGTGPTPSQIKQRIRKIMNDKMDYMKSKEKMEEARDMINRIKDETLSMRLDTRAVRFEYDWVEALDAVNMAELASLIVSASMIRTESRGPFQREDYPQTKDEWIKNIVVTKGEAGPKFSIVPVPLTYYKPVTGN